MARNYCTRAFTKAAGRNEPVFACETNQREIMRVRTLNENVNTIAAGGKLRGRDFFRGSSVGGAVVVSAAGFHAAANLE